jgi:hypothetical protein
MSGQYFGERVDPSDRYESTEPVVTSPVVDLAPDTCTVQEATSLGLETPVIEAAPVDDMAVQMAPASDPVLYIGPVNETMKPGVATSPIVASSPAALISHEEAEHFRTRWNEIQGKFIDEPRLAVQQADALVSEVIAQITSMFANEHSSLDGQWNQGNDVSTEDLRKIIQRYRSFFNRLVL